MVSLSCWAAVPEIFLYTTDLQENPFEFMRRQQPFMLHVQVKNMGSNFQPPQEIAGTKTCIVAAAGTAHSTSIVNGRRDETFAYNYVVRGTREGEFTFGPIQAVAADGSQVVSNTVTVVISDHALVHKTAQEPFLFEVSVDKKKVYVNEKVTVTMRFYYRYNYDQLEIVEPEYKDFFVGLKSSAAKPGKKTINGQEFLYKEFTVHLYPKAPGEQELLPARALFFDASSSRSMFSGFMNGLFGSKKQLYSQVVDISVVPLPPHPQGKVVHAVGEFTQVSFSLAETSAAVGKAVVGKYSITGQGNFEMIGLPSLNLPESIRSYASADSIKKLSATESEKLFEIVVQGSKPGRFTVPEQTFVYFDTRTKSYKTLHTEEVEIEFTGTALPTKPEQQKKDLNKTGADQTAEPEAVKFSFKDWQIDAVFRADGDVHHSNGLMPAGDRFLLLLSALLFCLCLWLGIMHRKRLGNFLWHSLFLQKVFIFSCLFFIKNGRKTQQQKIESVYNLFNHFFYSHGFDLRQDSGILFLQSINCSPEQQTEWKKYIDIMMPVMYAHDREGQQAMTDFDLFYRGAKRMFQIFFRSIKESRGQK